jgi:hypothetical protein
VLQIQFLLLTLIPLFSGVTPLETGDKSSIVSMMRMEQSLSKEFLCGTWKFSEEFFRWGATDLNRSTVRQSRGNALMILRSDGTMEMRKLFLPSQGLWELTTGGIIIHDPNHPERPSRLLPVKKKSDDGIWILLPFSNGAVGIGMVKVSEAPSPGND